MVGAIRPLADSVEAQLSNEKLLALLSACFGVLALGLTAVGVYGVIAYAVQRRTQEIGIRLALGAERAAVSRMMMRDVGLLALAGTVLGAAGAIAATRALRTMLFGFGTADYTLLAGAAAVLVAFAAAAGYLPARRAAAMDPMSALRQECGSGTSVSFASLRLCEKSSVSRKEERFLAKTLRSQRRVSWTACVS